MVIQRDPATGLYLPDVKKAKEVLERQSVTVKETIVTESVSTFHLTSHFWFSLPSSRLGFPSENLDEAKHLLNISN